LCKGPSLSPPQSTLAIDRLRLAHHPQQLVAAELRWLASAGSSTPQAQMEANAGSSTPQA